MTAPDWKVLAQAANRRLHELDAALVVAKEALESIARQLRCDADCVRIWHPYRKHDPECRWEVREDAEEALTRIDEILAGGVTSLSPRVAAGGSTSSAQGAEGAPGSAEGHSCTAGLSASATAGHARLPTPSTEGHRESGAASPAEAVCDRCDGCGSVGDDADAGPWWAYASNAGVKPVRCPECGGAGRVPAEEAP